MRGTGGAAWPLRCGVDDDIRENAIATAILYERVRTAEQLAQMAVNTAKATVNSFIGYLEDEHSAPPGEGWTIRDIQTGFERPEAPPPEGKST